ncbi:MAG TPA: PQQ-binding-like beta-propeller repeat protein [Micromonosporaceae bacterium]|nr:PQQ-binding-like beta-propeller repeat protein [Micromonosporaceae bacterium]
MDDDLTDSGDDHGGESPYARPDDDDTGSPSARPGTAASTPAATPAGVEPLAAAPRDIPSDRTYAYPRSPWQPDESIATTLPPSPVQPNSSPSVDVALSEARPLTKLEDSDLDMIDIGDVRDGIDAVSRAEVRAESARTRLVRRLGRSPARRRATGAPVIDLGERHGRMSAADRLGALSPWWRANVVWREHARPTVAVAIAVLALLVGGSVAPPLPRMSPISSISMPLGAAFAVDGTRAVVLASRDGVGESIAAYAVAGGHRAWFTELPIRQADDVGMTMTDGIVLVSAGRFGNRGPHTLAVDEKSGRLLWTSPLSLVSPRRGSESVLASDGPANVASLDKRTGEQSWSVPVGATCSTDVAVPGDAEVANALVELCTATGVLSRIDLDTGAVRATSHISLTSTEKAGATMFTVANEVVVEDSAQKPPLISAYALDSLRPVWTTRAFTPNDSAYACGSDICVSSGGLTALLDARTGALIPTLPNANELATVVPRPFVPATVIGTLLLPTPGTVLPITNRSTYVASHVAEQMVVHVPLFRPGRTWVVTMSAGGVRDAVQLLDGPAADVCLPVGSYLACMTAKQIMTFWVLPTVP